MSSRPQSQTASSATATTDDDRLNPKFNSSTLDFLLIELVPLVQRLSEQTLAREQQVVDEYQRSKFFPPPTTTDDKNGGLEVEKEVAGRDGVGKAVTGGGKDGVNGVTSIGFPVVRDPVREAMLFRLDALGYRVGQGLVERFSTNKPRPTTSLDAIKFICKDLWQLIFRKPIDNLKTNHRGIFVLTDNKFQPLSRMSIDRRAGLRAGEESAARAQLYLHFPSGIIRGVLQGLGIEASVSGDLSEIPTATFQIKTKGAKP